MSLSEDQQLPNLSVELSRKLIVDIVGLSEIRRPGNGGINNSGDFTNYWSGQSIGTQLRGPAIAIHSQFQSSVVVTLVDERMMPVRLEHTLGFLSLITAYAPIEMYITKEKGIY